MSTVERNLRVTRGLTERWLREVFSEPVGALIMVSIRPIVWYVLFGSLFEAVSALPGFPAENYRAFILPGVIVLISLEFISIGGKSIVEDIEHGFLQKMWAAPISKLSVVWGRLITMLTLNAIQILLVLAIAYADGVRFETGASGAALVLAMALLFTAVTSSVSLAIAYSIQHDFSFFVVTSFFVLPVIFVSSAFVPLELMPDWLGTVAEYNPITITIDAMRTLVIDGYVKDEILPAFVLLPVAVIVTSTFASISFGRSIDRD